MKKFLVFFLTLNLLLPSFAPSNVLSGKDNRGSISEDFPTATYTSKDLTNLPSGPAFDHDFLPASAAWLEAVGNEEPATFSSDKITCVLADNVIKVNQNITGSIADMGQILSGSTVQKTAANRIIEKGGYIARSVLDAAVTQKIENGSVVVDEATGTAFKVVSPTVYTGVFDTDPELIQMVKPLENTYSLTKPELHEVVKEFELKEDTVTLNKANITEFAPNVESSIAPLSKAKFMAVGDEDKMFKYLKGDNLIEFDFKDAALNGKVGDSSISVKLSGGIAIDAIQLTGRYSSMGGYELSMTLQQECYIIAELDAEVHEEIRIPLLGLDIPFGVGEVYGGIFALIGMDGTIQLGIEARETSACTMGIEGGTFLYVPTSFHPIFKPTPPKITGDCEMNGKINGYVKVGPMVGIELFGFDLVSAGILLGAGVNVQSDGAMLNIELYASIDVYIVLAGKGFTLVRSRPTIYKKQQPDLYGYKVSFLETYVSPGRVGGLIEQEPAEAGGAFIPAENLEYRVWIVPKNAVDAFVAAKRESILSVAKADAVKPLKEKVRTYPEDSFARTNEEGEFFEEDDAICFAGDQIYLEFKGIINNVEQTIFAGPAKPVLPFTEVTVTYADYFNDYITGKVEPKRLIKWDSNRLDPDEIQTELAYYKGLLSISPFNDYGMVPGSYGPHAQHMPHTASGKVWTESNDKGEFDTRNLYTGDEVSDTGGVIDVLEQTFSENFYYDANGVKQYFPIYSPSLIGVHASININDAVNNTIIYGIKPSSPDFQLTRTLDVVENSYQTFNEGDKIVNQMSYDEYLWIANPTGTRTITADMLTYYIKGFSSQDYKGYNENPIKETRDGPITLTPILDAHGNPTGTAMFAQRITVQWVWQEHPNPIKITSAAKTQATAGGESSFQVTSEGFLPKFSLDGAPQRVWIDEDTGLLYIPQTLEPGTYTFTIQAREGIAVTSIVGPDPKKGNDSSLPDKQLFTLTITAKPSGSSSSQSSVSSSASSSSSNSSALTAPVIYVDEYNTYIDMDGSADLTVPFKASGSTPITWSLSAVSGQALPSEITINALTGVMTVKKSLLAGTWSFAVKASNGAGSNLHECTIVMAERVVPVLENRRDGYQFTMTTAKTDFAVTIRATGSTPITYSLVQVNTRLPIPAEITLDPATGILKVKGGLIGGIKAGVYDFIVKAANDVGSSTRTCKLTVTASLTFSIAPKNQNLAYQNVNGLEIIPLAVSGKTEVDKVDPSVILTPDLFAKEPPPNKITLRCDDPKDVYTHDRFVTNGANYIHWDTRVVITVMKVFVSKTLALGNDGHPYVELIPLGAEMEIKDNTPYCDNYHYYHPDGQSTTLPISEEELAAIRADMKKIIDTKMAEYKNGYQSVRQDFSTGGLMDRYFGSGGTLLEREISTLEYGSTVKEISSQKGGAYSIGLNQETGTVLAGAYFTALKGNPGASLTFKQDGVEITFAGNDIISANALDLINIGLTTAAHETMMLNRIGEGFQNFAFGFQHHGALPGMATFAISTTLAEGTKANVYKFDTATGKFLLIKKGVVVGSKGVMTYKNNTMSEYLVTTRTITDPALLVSDNGIAKLTRTVLWIVVPVLVLLIIGVAVWLILRRRKKGNPKS